MTQSSLKELTLGKEGDEFNPPKPNLSIKQHETHRRSYNRALKGVGGGGGGYWPWGNERRLPGGGGI